MPRRAAGTLPGVRARSRDTSPDQPFAAQAVSQEIDDGRGPDLGLAGRQEHRRVAQSLLEGARRGSQHRCAARHRLERRKPEALVQRRLDVERRARVEERQLVLVAKGARELNAAQDARALRALRERMSQSPGRTREHEREALRPGKPLQRVDQERQILVLLPRADIEDVRGRERSVPQEALRIGGGSPRELLGDSERDHAHAIRRHSQDLLHVVPYVARVHEHHARLAHRGARDGARVDSGSRREESREANVDQVMDGDDRRALQGERKRVVGRVVEVHLGAAGRAGQVPVLGDRVFARLDADLFRRGAGMGEGAEVVAEEEDYVLMAVRSHQENGEQISDVGSDAAVAQLPRVHSDSQRYPPGIGRS